MGHMKSFGNEKNDDDSLGHDLRTIEHRYFFVEKFYKTNFKKVSAGASMGTRISDLSYLLKTDESTDVRTDCRYAKKQELKLSSNAQEV